MTRQTTNKQEFSATTTKPTESDKTTTTTTKQSKEDQSKTLEDERQQEKLTKQQQQQQPKQKQQQSKDDDQKGANFKRFEGEGVQFKAKLIGSELVIEPRGDKICQDSIQRLKAIIRGQKAHKRRINMKISYKGVKILDEKTSELLYHSEVSQISFIASDDTDPRCFGYICDVPDKAHRFICFKTSGPAVQVMSVISSLFEAVLEQKKAAERSLTTNLENSLNDSKEEEQQQQQQQDLTDVDKKAKATINSLSKQVSLTDDYLEFGPSSSSGGGGGSGNNASDLNDLSNIEISNNNNNNNNNNNSLISNNNSANNNSGKFSAFDLVQEQLGDLFLGPQPQAPASQATTTTTAILGQQQSEHSFDTQFNQWDQATGQQQPHHLVKQSTLKSDSFGATSNQTMMMSSMGDSGILSSPTSPPIMLQRPPAGRRISQHQQQQQQPVLSSSMAAKSSHFAVAATGEDPFVSRHVGGKLVHNYSSVSLNDAALTRQSSFGAMQQQQQHQTPLVLPGSGDADKYAVFNDIENLPSIFESSSSLNLADTTTSNSTNKLTNFATPNQQASFSHQLNQQQQHQFAHHQQPVAEFQQQQQHQHHRHHQQQQPLQQHQSLQRHTADVFFSSSTGGDFCFGSSTGGGAQTGRSAPSNAALFTAHPGGPNLFLANNNNNNQGGVALSGSGNVSTNQPQFYQNQQVQFQHQQQQMPMQHMMMTQNQHHQQQQQLSSDVGATVTPSIPIELPPHQSFGQKTLVSSGSNLGLNSMLVGSAPMSSLHGPDGKPLSQIHQAQIEQQHARFSSSLAAGGVGGGGAASSGLNQYFGSSMASLQSASSASGLARQTNPFDDDFFA